MKIIRPQVPQVVQLAKKSRSELGLTNSSRTAIVFIGIFTLIVALHLGKVFLAPVTLAIVVGLMFGPVAARVERFGVPSGLSALIVVLLLLGMILTASALFSAPLSEWVARAPAMWVKFREQISALREPLQAIRNFGAQVKTMTSGNGATSQMEVIVDDNSTVKQLATLAPTVFAEILIFLASLYFYVATRNKFKTSVLKLFYNRRSRWQATRMFNDIESHVSRYLLSITIVNAGLGFSVAFAMWALGVPSPALWGSLAFVMNYVIYIGPAIMTVTMLAIGLSTMPNLVTGLLPGIVYLGLHMTEAQAVTPHVIGRTMTMNPFLVFLTITFWLWLWGPIGGFIAVPFLLICYAVARNLLPQKNVLNFQTTKLP